MPIYNMEKLMHKCLDSILAQSFKYFECLLIDDGSTDGSPAICDEYAVKDNRFRAFHKPNGGLSDARNYGLERAQGEFSIFADPDDWLDHTGLDELWKFAKQNDLDVAMCDIWVNNEFSQTYKSCKPSSMSNSVLQKELLTGAVPSFTVNKLIRTSLYKEYNVKYPSGIYGCEDQYTMCSLFIHPIRVDYLPISFYHYMHMGQATQSHYYDSNTYQIDKKIIKMFVELYKGTPYHELAYTRKVSYMVGHAFFEGYNVFSNRSFLREFGEYEELLKEVPRMKTTNYLYWLSFRGHYHLARKTFDILLKCKRFYNKLR